MGCTANSNIKTNESNQFHSLDNAQISEMFIDKIFPPENSSIFGDDNLEKIKNGEKIKNSKIFEELIDDLNQNNIIWKRAKEIFNNQEFTLFSSDLSLNSIIQGSIGNCYFLSIISGLTKFPSLIYQLFNSLSISCNGCYEIKLKINNKIEIISLDDFFPYNIKTNMPLFCKPYRNEIWVMLLEKAWAKIKGNYLNIDNGSPYDVLDSFLLSSSIEKDVLYKSYFINEDNKYQIWENLVNKNENKKNIIMICLSKDKINNKKKLNNFYYSIVEKHFYNIEEINKNTEKEKILKLRNPWGFNLKNENYNKKKNEFHFIIDDNESQENENEKEYLLSGGEFLIDYKYFCYLFQEIQIFEIKNFSFSYIINKIEEKPLNIFYFNSIESKNQEFEILVNINLKNIKKNPNIKDINKENNYLSILLVIIDLDNAFIVNKYNEKINLSNKNSKTEFTFMLNQEFSREYYFCLVFLPNDNLKFYENLEFDIIFQSQEYCYFLNDIKFIQNNQIYEIIKIEFEQYKFDFDYIKIDDKNSNDFG